MNFSKFILANIIFGIFAIACILEVVTAILLIVHPILCLCVSGFNGFRVGEYFYIFIFVLGMFPAVIYSLPCMIKNIKRIWDFKIVWNNKK